MTDVDFFIDMFINKHKNWLPTPWIIITITIVIVRLSTYKLNFYLELMIRSILNNFQFELFIKVYHRHDYQMVNNISVLTWWLYADRIAGERIKV